MCAETPPRPRDSRWRGGAVCRDDVRGLSVRDGSGGGGRVQRPHTPRRQMAAPTPRWARCVQRRRCDALIQDGGGGAVCSSAPRPGACAVAAPREPAAARACEAAAAPVVGASSCLPASGRRRQPSPAAAASSRSGGGRALWATRDEGWRDPEHMLEAPGVSPLTSGPRCGHRPGMSGASDSPENLEDSLLRGGLAVTEVSHARCSRAVCRLGLGEPPRGRCPASSPPPGA